MFILNVTNDFENNTSTANAFSDYYTVNITKLNEKGGYTHELLRRD